jgi:alkanesulfonate monooxygenase SsuD/methylene tetrahydromethanopterin reductase-like flavin-dependent oxidoreductase (luciferase family)
MAVRPPGRVGARPAAGAGVLDDPNCHCGDSAASGDRANGPQRRQSPSWNTWRDGSHASGSQWGRLLLGIGAGGGRHTPYAAEQQVFGRPVLGDTARRAALEVAVATIRSVWTGTIDGVGGFLRPDPTPPIIIGGFGPKMAELAGRVADGVNLPAGPGLGRLVEVARASRAASARHSSPFVVTVSSDLSAAARERLKELDVDRAVVFVTPPFASHVRGLAASQR